MDFVGFDMIVNILEEKNIDLFSKEGRRSLELILNDKIINVRGEENPLLLQSLSMCRDEFFTFFSQNFDGNFYSSNFISI